MAQYEHVELACDGVITDLAYCPDRYVNILYRASVI